MPYNYLDLSNQVLARMNEVTFTEATFGAGKGFHRTVKDSINAAIRDINEAAVEWPFNYIQHTQTLTPDQTRYSFPTDTRSIDFESFRLKSNSELQVQGGNLGLLSYDDYLNRFSIQEDHTGDSYAGAPEAVFQARNLEYGFVPRPNAEYEVVFEYYSQPADMVNALDVPLIPEAYRFVIVDGATYHAHMFRDNSEMTAEMKDRFKEGIKGMRRILVNRNEYMRSTQLSRGRNTGISGGVASLGGGSGGTSTFVWG